MNKTLPCGVTPDTLVDLHETAADWFTRRTQPAWTDADEQALAAWLDADPLHREIFDSLQRTHELLGQLRPASTERVTAAGTASRAPTPRPIPPVPARRRTLWSSTAAVLTAPVLTTLTLVLCVAVGGGWHVWNNTPRHGMDVATRAGETRQVQLPDGTQIALNVASTLQVRYYPRRREVTLLQGEAFFEVARDAERPFTVDAGQTRITVTGTAFNVRATPARLVVQVREGKVQVRPDQADTRSPRVALEANMGLAIDATGRPTPVPTQADAVGGWRTGQLRFRRTPLAEVADELARYLGQPVTITSPALATVPLSGFFETSSPEAFLRLLPDLVPVQVSAQPDGGWQISAR